MSVLPGAVLEGAVNRIMPYGALIKLPDGRFGMVHISEISNTFVTDINEFIKVGDPVSVQVLNIDEKGRINLSMKRLEKLREKQIVYEKPAAQPPANFEDMMGKFMKDSEERLLDYKRSIGRRSGGYSRR